QRHGRARLQAEKTAEPDERLILDLLAFPEARRAETGEREERKRHRVVHAERVTDRQAVLRPSAIEQRRDAGVEEVEEVAEGRILEVEPVLNGDRVEPRQYAQRTGEPDEVDQHLPLGRVGIERLDRTGRKRERRISAEAYHFTRGLVKESDAPAAHTKLFE